MGVALACGRNGVLECLCWSDHCGKAVAGPRRIGVGDLRLRESQGEGGGGRGGVRVHCRSDLRLHAPLGGRAGALIQPRALS